MGDEELPWGMDVKELKAKARTSIDDAHEVIEVLLPIIDEIADDVIEFTEKHQAGASSGVRIHKVDRLRRLESVVATARHHLNSNGERAVIGFRSRVPRFRQDRDKAQTEALIYKLQAATEWIKDNFEDEDFREACDFIKQQEQYFWDQWHTLKRRDLGIVEEEAA